jgi:hypothetical protein
VSSCVRQAFTTFWADRHSAAYKLLVLDADRAVNRAAHPPTPQSAAGCPGVAPSADLTPTDAGGGGGGGGAAAAERGAAVGHLVVGVMEAADLDSCAGVAPRRLNPYVVIRCADRCAA